MRGICERRVCAEKVKSNARYVVGICGLSIWLAPNLVHPGRGCLGQRYAQHTVTLLMGMILQRYTVELAPNTGPELQLKQLNLTYGSKHGVFLRFIPRSACHV